MGFWDNLRGRSTPPRANLDALFLVPSAAITLQTAAALTPTGLGAVCYRAAEGSAFAQTQTEVQELLDSDEYGPPVERQTDKFGFTWLISRQDDMSVLCTDLHAINTTLEAQGFGGGLLCSVVPFAAADGRKVGLVYLYKQGTFYPFAPAGDERRDNMFELQVRDHLAAELPMEKQLNRWLAVWGAPGL
jgi:hypothetical protein